MEAALEDFGGAFVSVSFAELNQHPLRTLSSIYDQMGWMLDDAAKAATTAELRRAAADSHKSHRSQLENLGLRPQPASG